MSTKAIDCISGQKCIADLRNHILIKTLFFPSSKKPQCSNTRPTVHQHKRQWSFGFSKVANTVKILQPQKELSVFSCEEKQRQNTVGVQREESDMRGGECFNRSQWLMLYGVCHVALLDTFSLALPSSYAFLCFPVEWNVPQLSWQRVGWTAAGEFLGRHNSSLWPGAELRLSAEQSGTGSRSMAGKQRTCHQYVLSWEFTTFGNIQESFRWIIVVFSISAIKL